MPADRTLPADLAAEGALLGCVLYDNAAFRAVEDVLTGDDFHEPIHGRIFDAVAAAVRHRGLADPITLGRALKDDPALQSLGGSRYLVDLVEKAPPTNRAPHYAEVISDQATRRRLITVGQGLVASAEKQEEGVAATDVIVSTERELGELAARGPTRAAWKSLGASYARQLRMSRDAKGLPPGIPTGIKELDAVMGGFRPGTVSLIAGRPGMGKSAAAISIMRNIAQQGHGIGFFSLEMPEEQVAVRFGCSLVYDRTAPVYSGSSTNPTYEDFEKGDLTDNQWLELERGQAIFDALPVSCDYRSNLRVTQIAAATRRLQRDWRLKGIKPGPIVIDHILKVAGADSRTFDPTQKFTQISNEVTDLAKSTGLPFVVLCQLNRGVEGREDKRPTLSDLKFTGALEEDAFSATFLFRPEYYNRPPEDTGTEDQRDKAWAKYNANKTRWSKKLLWLLEKNRGGRAQQQIESYCDIGCNAIEDVAIAEKEEPVFAGDEYEGYAR